MTAEGTSPLSRRQEEDTPTISYRALQRARTTIEDFAKTYLPLHGLTVEKDFFAFWDILVYVEATIYALDEDNEDAVQAAALRTNGGSGDGGCLADVPEPCSQGQAERCLTHALKSRGLWDARIRDELQQGFVYWRLERKLCAAMAARPSPNLLDGGPTPGLTLPQVLACHEAKSFDYRLLHLLLHRLKAQREQQREQRQQWQGRRQGGPVVIAGGVGGPGGGGSSIPGVGGSSVRKVPANNDGGGQNVPDVVDDDVEFRYDDALLAFLLVDEMLVDIGDDLTDYEDDVERNSFNTYRAYLHLFGAEAREKLVDRISTLEARHAVLKAALPRAQRDAFSRRQREAAVDEYDDVSDGDAGGDGGGDDISGGDDGSSGGNGGGVPGATGHWVLPPPIWDESAFQRDVCGLNEAG